MYYKNSFFSSVTATAGTENELACILEGIKAGVYADRIAKIRELYAAEDNSEADVLKRSLPGFTPSATFSGGRKLENLKEYQQLLVLDVDKVESDKLQEVNQKARDCKYTLACFVSPSGHGLKILVKTTADQVSHGDCFAQVADYYKAWLGVDIDRSGKDITRLCFVSYDPDLYISTDSEPWPFTVDSQDWAKIFQDTVSHTENVKEFEPGNRNNFVYQLACNLNRAGMPEDEALRLIMEKYQSGDFTAAEIQATVRSAYNNNISEFGDMARMAHMAHSIISEDSPLFPDTVYDMLPGLLKDITQHFSDKRERDLILLSSLTVLSGIFPSVYGTYDKRKNHGNLYLMVAAPAASGKGVIKSSRDLVKPIHSEWEEKSKEELGRFYQEYKNVRNLPTAPPLRLLLIPANTTQPDFIDKLHGNDGVGIIFETEADTVSEQWRRDWSNYSTTLRSAFHHEPVEYSRKTRRQYVNVEKPKLSIVLSGTLDQVPRLIRSIENGLFSRFIYYTYNRSVQWRNVFEKGEPLETAFERYGQQVKQLYSFYEGTEIEFRLTSHQEDELNRICSEGLINTSLYFGDEASSIPLRLGLMWFRMAMVLTCIRQFNAEGHPPSNLVCGDEDFEICTTLIPLLLEHAYKVLELLPHSTSESNEGEGEAIKFLNDLPCGEEVSRKDMTKYAKRRIANRTLSKYLNILQNLKLLSRIRHGFYKRDCE